MPRLIAAAIQMTSTADKEHNLDTASRLVEEDAGRGATLAVLPELMTVLGEPEVIVAGAEEVPGPASRRLGELAAHLGITLLAGSLAERRSRTRLRLLEQNCYRQSF